MKLLRLWRKAALACPILLLFACSGSLREIKTSPEMFPDFFRMNFKKNVDSGNDFSASLIADSCGINPIILDSLQAHYMQMLIQYVQSIEGKGALPPATKESNANYENILSSQSRQFSSFMNQLRNANIPMVRVKKSSALALCALLSQNIPLLARTKNVVKVRSCNYRFSSLDVMVGYRIEKAVQPESEPQVIFYFLSGYHSKCAANALATSTLFFALSDSLEENTRMETAIYAATSEEGSVLRKMSVRKMESVCADCVPAEF